MRHGGGDHQQQTRSRGQRRRNRTGRDQCNHPIRQSGNLGIREDHNVAVNAELVALPAVAICFVCKRRILIVVVLHSTIAILVIERDQPSLLPGAKPVGPFVVGKIAFNGADGTCLNRVDQVVTGHRTDCRGGRVQNRNEKQRIASRQARITNLGYGEESHDDMRQACCAHHERQRDTENINTTLGA